MPNEVNDIVDVSITAESSAISRQGFSTPMCISTHVVGDPVRIQYFEGSDILGDMVTAGFATTSTAYKQAAAVLRQVPRPPRIAIGRRDADDADVDTTMNAIAAEDDDGWYIFCHETRTAADLEDLAAWTEASNHKYIAQTVDAAVRAGTAGNIAELLQTAGYRRTVLLVRQVAEDWADAGWLGKVTTADLDAVDGQITWALKSLAGITPDTYTAPQRTTIHGYNANTYETRAGSNITFPGTSSHGEFADIQVTIDWTDARMTEDVFAGLVNTPTKIPFVQAGMNAQELLVRRRLQIGMSNGHYSSFIVTPLRYEDVLSSDRAARVLRTLDWSAVPTGAIHTVKVRGRVAI